MVAESIPAPFTADLKVLVLAGSNPTSSRRKRRRELRRQRGEREVPLDNKAFLPLRGKLVIEHLLDAVAAVGLRQVWISAPPEWLDLLPEPERFSLLPQQPGSTLVMNLARAYAEVTPAEDEPVLILFGDHPVTTPRALHDFLGACAAGLEQADYFHGLALQEAYADFAPLCTRTSGHLREMSGRASGLNLAVPSRLHRLRALDQMYSVRKMERLGSFFWLLVHLTRVLGRRSPVALFDATVIYLAKEFEKLGRRSGALGRLGRRLERLASRLVPAARVEGYGARILDADRGARLVPLRHGGIAIDVDFAEELDTLENEWEALTAIAERHDRESRAAGGSFRTRGRSVPHGRRFDSRAADRAG